MTAPVMDGAATATARVVFGWVCWVYTRMAAPQRLRKAAAAHTGAGQ
eukprot:CAMPEP_0202857510 /NCGR_PEP_ID=MMETSP1391-20130828/421_1 /ASSEMBLY_ACC=CAM_ASM_000867 /TAXON_ID=1034604 /ORGANISM="Chlamydomonas leiostraca, Strain SAG 11-49" /LENGTH=46 /DNA_ID= /DNA_START= /DNA_END= /DNA_ORIENTATION=